MYFKGNNSSFHILLICFTSQQNNLNHKAFSYNNIIKTYIIISNKGVIIICYMAYLVINK